MGGNVHAKDIFASYFSDQIMYMTLDSLLNYVKDNNLENVSEPDFN